MAATKLTLASLGDLDKGRVGHCVQNSIEAAVKDCRDRPGLKVARKIIITVMIDPQMDDEDELAGNELLDAHVNVEVATKFPSRKSRTYSMGLTKRSAIFNELTPDNVRQATIDDPNGMFRVIDEDNASDDDEGDLAVAGSGD